MEAKIIRVLIVDDQSPHLKQTVSELEDRDDIEAVSATSGEEALKILENDPWIRVVITQYRMGVGMTGFELAEQILERDDIDDVQVIVVTSSKVIATPSGVTAIYRKPTTPWELYRAIRGK